MPRPKKTETVAKAPVKKTVKAAVKPVAVKKTTVAKRSLKIDVYDVKGSVVESMTLPEAVFGAKVNKPLLAQAVRIFLANQRQGNAQAKTRGMVAGSTKKMGRQKGGGRARHGSIRAPIYVGGGKAHGPQPTDHSLALPKKMRKAALYSALSAKLQDNGVWVIDGFEKTATKTAAAAKAMQAQSFANTKKMPSILLVTPENKPEIYRTTRNIPFVTTEPVQNLHTYEVLRAKTVVFMKEAIEKL